MIFGEAESESPRVPSPWTNNDAARSRSGGLGRTRTSGRQSGSQSPRLQHTVSGGSAGISPTASPLSRAVRIRNAKAADGSLDTVLVSPADDDDEDVNDDSLTSTPPTEDDDDVLDAFFALETDLDSLSIAQLDEEKHDTIKPSSANRPSRKLRQLAPEPDLLGNLEYKLRIVPPTRHRFDKLLTQLKWRLLQGGGECMYELGVLDDGQCLGICPLEMRASLCVLSRMAGELNAWTCVRKAFFVVLEDRPHVSPMPGQIKAGEGALLPMTQEQVRSLLLGELDATTSHCPCGVTAHDLHEVISYADPLSEEVNETPDHLLSIPHSTVDAEAGEMVIDLEEVPHLPDANDAADVVTAAVLEDGHELTTFSLSLDEKATQSGLGYAPRRQRKACHYVDVGRRQAVSAVQAAEGAPGGTAIGVHRQTHVTTASAASVDIPASAQPSCLRVLMEVSLHSTPDGDAFIDYASF